jgi:predicted Zn finger-like uncharacterized protein
LKKSISVPTRIGMIVQCDECKAKFKLDESRIGANGAKVRCSKCRHVFMVQHSSTRDEEDMDSLLSGFDTGAPSEPATPEVPASAGEGAGSFSFSGLMGDADTGPTSDEPAPGTVPSSTGAFEFGDDLFSDEQESKVSSTQEFDFAPDTVAAPETPADTGGFGGAREEFDFSEDTHEPFSSPPASFAGQSDASATAPSFDDEAPGDIFAAALPAAAATSFDFGDLDDTAESPPSAASTPVPSSGALDIDFGDVTVSEVAAAPAAAEEFSFDEGASFDFSEESIVAKEASAAFEVGEFPDSSTEGALTCSVRGEDVQGGVSFAAEAESAPEFSFDFATAGDADLESATSPPPADESPVQWHMPAEPAPVSPTVSASVAPTAGKPKETQAAVPVPPEVAEMSDDLPPLSIASRRKSSQAMPFVAILTAIVILGGVAGAGYYLFRGGAAAFNRFGLGFVSSWLGMEVKEEGSIAVQKTSASFTANKEVGELFVVRGEALNRYRSPRGSLLVKVLLYGKDGRVLAQKTAFCGNVLPDDQLATMPWAKIEGAMANQFGDSLGNLGVSPGKTIPFVVVFSGVPKDVADFAVESAGSTVAGQ